ncbi:hypothetical protein FRC20_002470 [Serendipita sp. 405]|nr:hypothetical protein FRC20_002470 [Serendipita sp. 405]
MARIILDTNKVSTEQSLVILDLISWRLASWDDPTGKTVKQVLKILDTRDESRTEEIREVEDILRIVKRRILDNQENHQKCCEVLRDGSEKLRLLLAKKKHPREIRKLFKEEERAIVLDYQYEELLNNSSNTSEKIDLQIYSMDGATDSPNRTAIGGEFFTYSEVVWYLHTQGIVEAPELWTRQGDGVQNVTPSGYCMKNRADYIVALVHEGDNEFPVPLDVPIFGRNTCCVPTYESLGMHLARLWSSQYTICRASRIKNPNQSVLHTALNTNTFTVRMNELYVKVERRNVSSPVDVSN